MDCREAKRLLPLWVGQDLPDAASMSEVSTHMEQCSSCAEFRNGLQSSLETLQCLTSTTLSTEVSRRSLWPKLVSQISEWDQNHRRERFNGWIPASVMALAVALMIGVSIPSIRDEFFGDGENLASAVDLFGQHPDIRFDAGMQRSQESGQGLPRSGEAYRTAVKFQQPHKSKPKSDRW